MNRLHLIGALLSLLPLSPNSALAADQVLLPFKNAADKWGYVDGQRRQVIPPTFDQAKRFHHGIGVVSGGGVVVSALRKVAYTPAHEIVHVLLNDGDHSIYPIVNHYRITPRPLLMNGLAKQLHEWPVHDWPKRVPQDDTEHSSGAALTQSQVEELRKSGFLE